ncbi:MAG: acyltransferase [Flavobacteriales bacterium]|jgi:acetyltransferase-like isoleucine patch superfamily enzyme
MLAKPGILERIIRRIFPPARPYMRYGITDALGKPIEGSRISSHTFIDHPNRLNLGKQVYIGHFNVLEASQGLSIGDGVQITTHCVITTHSSHLSLRLYGPDYKGDTMVGYVKGPVHVGKYTFVGPHSTLMPGTTIGKGCLVQAYSYVKGNFPDFSILGGNPAKIIGDTRQLDQKYLEEHPELKPTYEAWTAEQ